MMRTFPRIGLFRVSPTFDNDPIMDAIKAEFKWILRREPRECDPQEIIYIGEHNAFDYVAFYGGIREYSCVITDSYEPGQPIKSTFRFVKR